MIELSNKIADYDGKERFYATFEVLSAYAKSWEKANNVCASQELMSGQLQGSSPEDQPRSNHLVARSVIAIEDSAVPSSLSMSASGKAPEAFPLALMLISSTASNLPECLYSRHGESCRCQSLVVLQSMWSKILSNSLLRMSKVTIEAPNVAAWFPEESVKNNTSEQPSVPVAIARKQRVQETATY